MDFIEQLIKSLEEAKAELTKGLNCTPGGQMMNKEELEKDAANPALAPKQVKVKQLQAQIDAGTYKPDSTKTAAAMLKDEDHPTTLMEGDVKKLIKEELICSANGQWDIKKI